MSIEDIYSAQQRELAERKAALLKTAAFQQELKKINRRDLAHKIDIDLAIWQTSYPPDSPQYLIAEKEWERRLTARQIKAGHLAALIGVAGSIIAALLGVCLGWWLSAHQIQRQQQDKDSQTKATVNGQH